MHREWCGKRCADCQHPCEVDKELYCSPDCECLGENGETNSPECWSCDAYLARVADEQPNEFMVDILSLPEGEALYEEIAELVSDYISDLTGLCHKGFSMDVAIKVSEIDYDRSGFDGDD